MPFAKDSDLARLALVAAQYKEQVGAAIRARREELGLTQPQLADLVETYLREHGHREDGQPFDSQNISRWERGKNLATTVNLEAVAYSLQTTPGEMLARVHAAEEQTARNPGGRNNGSPGPDQLARIEAKLDRLLEQQGLSSEEIVAEFNREADRIVADAYADAEPQQPPKPSRTGHAQGKAPGRRRRSA